MKKMNLRIMGILVILAISMITYSTVSSKEVLAQAYKDNIAGAVFNGGYKVQSYDEIVFEKDRWNQMGTSSCITYTAKLEYPFAKLVVNLSSSRTLYEYPNGTTVQVCGAIVHLPPK